MNCLLRSLLCAGTFIAAGQAASAQSSYTGMGDASAAEPLGNGHFIVADDESDVLRIYKRDTAAPVASVDLTDVLRNRKPSGKAVEADIEGAAMVGERIYWISSHARKGKSGDADPNRHRLFATDIDRSGPVPTVKPVGQVHEALLQELLQDPRFDVLKTASERKPEDKDGLNIEGLASTPEGGLLIGFRNPLPKGRALVVLLLNPQQVIDGGARPQFGELIRLDLGQRGIRSIERAGHDYLIAAGPFATASQSKARPAFALYRWSGKPGAKPEKLQSLDNGSFRAEALFFDADTRDIVLLSDDGDEQVGPVDCKDKSVPADRKSFRSWVLPWPAAHP
ncbi:DUF3616 domain-containing protein [Piscinibacter terrae]|nr:DUF3616 domain-containing protein [Albitalea terrae]